MEKEGLWTGIENLKFAYLEERRNSSDWLIEKLIDRCMYLRNKLINPRINIITVFQGSDLKLHTSRNTSEHEWNTCQHEWNTSEHEWNTSELE